MTGVILAGGRSSRFGENKAFATFQGVPLIERVVSVMGALFQDLLVVTNTPEEYSSWNIPLITDHQPYQGPLGAIATALEKTSKEGIIVVACDMPMLVPEILTHIMKQAKASYPAVVPIHDGVREYLMAYYAKSLLPLMQQSLQKGHYSLKEFCALLPRVAWVPIDGNSWLNVNTKKDLESLEEHYAR
ncbi:MAG: molybdenum cofactor guanylyltransferase [Deltaproteobacteria bacterium]|nr:molybdenum cofactor guanylyltransferase [Deltaproteobacteria bacterium]